MKVDINFIKKKCPEFRKAYNEYLKEISKLLGEVLGNKAKKIHGSRDYYQLIVHGIIFEIIPVLKVKKPEHAKNITDLSYFHVNYINKKIRKNKKLIHISDSN